MSVRLKEIAERAGMSLQTISLALNGRPGPSKKTREKVLKLAAEMGYRPNAAAQAIRKGRFDAIGLLRAEDPIMASISPGTFFGIEEGLDERRLRLVIDTATDSALSSDDSVPFFLSSFSVDGMLVSHGRPSEEAMQMFMTYNIPCVWINVKRKQNCVHPDDFGGIKAATEHLLKLGHKRIGYIGHIDSSTHYSFNDRHDGYKAAMSEAGIEPIAIDLGKDDRDCRGPEAFRDLLAFMKAKAPTAIIQTLGSAGIVFFAAHELGLRVPEDLSILTMQDPAYLNVGSDFSYYGEKRLTRLELPSKEMGRASVSVLADMLAGETVEAEPIVLPFAFHNGETTGPAPE